MTTSFKNADFIKSLSPGVALINSLTLQRNVAIGCVVMLSAIAGYYIYQDVKRLENVKVAAAPARTRAPLV